MIEDKLGFNMKAYVAELIGTFVLVLAGTGAIMFDQMSGGAITHVGVAVVFGLVVMAMIYAVGDTSGAHLNPAVTIAFWAAGRFPLKQILPYSIAQIAGAILASLFLYLFVFGIGGVTTMGETVPNTNIAGITVWHAFALEIVLTAILMFVILCVSSGSKEVGTLAGIAIGGTVALDAMFGGPICGASMNPARSIGPAIFAGKFSTLWAYIVAPIIGAVIVTPWARWARDCGDCACGDRVCD